MENSILNGEPITVAITPENFGLYYEEVKPLALLLDILPGSKLLFCTDWRKFKVMWENTEIMFSVYTRRYGVHSIVPAIGLPNTPNNIFKPNLKAFQKWAEYWGKSAEDTKRRKEEAEKRYSDFLKSLEGLDYKINSEGYGHIQTSCFFQTFQISGEGIVYWRNIETRSGKEKIDLLKALKEAGL